MRFSVAFCRIREVSKVDGEPLANGNVVLRGPKGSKAPRAEEGLRWER